MLKKGVKISQISKENTCDGVFLWGKESQGQRNSNAAIFQLNFVKSLRTPILKNICEQLLMYFHVTLFTMHEKDTANDG